MTGDSSWMTAPKWARMLVFLWAVLSVSSFMGQFAFFVSNYFTKGSFSDSIWEMGFLYILALRFADFIPSVYVLLYEGLAQGSGSIFSPDYGKWEPHVDPSE